MKKTRYYHYAEINLIRLLLFIAQLRIIDDSIYPDQQRKTEYLHRLGYIR